MIDWTKPIENTKGERVILAGEFKYYSEKRYVIQKGSAYWVCNEFGMMQSNCGFGSIPSDIRNAPAPAQKCEHRHIDQNSKCIYCGEQRPLPPDPANAVTFSNTAPPDSVSIARRIAGSSGVIDATDFREFCNAYVTEQACQRKAAGELAEQLKSVVSWHDEYASSVPYGNMMNSFHKALAADAETRAGKY